MKRLLTNIYKFTHVAILILLAQIICVPRLQLATWRQQRIVISAYCQHEQVYSIKDTMSLIEYVLCCYLPLEQVGVDIKQSLLV